ncbi:polysaccharide biosynthesis/export family protein [Burkholderia multivorans]|uniref:polysaccharide biosynthesis/export family protein n=1 Tax=Burkholderia multivorans TaxID=87883 RepID=UPI000CFE5CAC|nr:polysaccharide biosynthesis/export family protein [Burkholderia multivorans]PRG34738.1 sugar transporter [Burkholderia multivorans]
MMNLSRAASLGLISTALALAACGTLPASGPSVSTVQKSTQDVDIVDVTPTMARDRAVSVEQEQHARVQQALATLAPTLQAPGFTFAAGDVLHVSLWTISPWPGSDSLQGASNVPTPIELGDFTVSEHGTIDLPYAGTETIGGLTATAAEHAIASTYAKLGILQRPSAKITVTSTPHGSIVVTGAIGAPKILPWTPAGLSLSAALTQSLGNGTDLMSSDTSATGERSATQVSVLRHGRSVTLPIEDALSQDVALAPGDRVLVKKSPVVRVTVVGGGASKNGVYGFAHVPTLSEVLASSSGLDPNSADDHAVFVLEERPDGQRPVLYDFSWQKVQGLVASHNFPLKDGDMVYVAEAPIVPVQRAINILFQLALPVQAVR